MLMFDFAEEMGSVGSFGWGKFGTAPCLFDWSVLGMIDIVRPGTVLVLLLITFWT